MSEKWNPQDLPHGLTRQVQSALVETHPDADVRVLSCDVTEYRTYAYDVTGIPDDQLPQAVGKLKRMVQPVLSVETILRANDAPVLDPPAAEIAVKVAVAQPIDQVSELGAEALDAAAELEQLGNSLMIALGERAPVSPTTRHRVPALAIDIHAASRTVVEMHDRHVADSKRPLLMMMENQGRAADVWWKDNQEESLDALRRLAAAFKGLMFFIRGLQDAVYVALLELDGEKTSKKTSMESCLNTENNLYCKMIVAKLPTYSEWFKGMRTLRNAMKEGIASSSSQLVLDGGPREFQISLTWPGGRGEVPVVRASLALADVVEGLRQSVDLLGLLLSEVEGRRS